jgi:hypothetical protein
MDRDRRYFISSGSSLEEGTPFLQQRWRQVDATANSEPARVQLTVSQPKSCELYYSTCAAVDQHNRERQTSLKVEMKLHGASGSIYPSFQCVLSILGRPGSKLLGAIVYRQIFTVPWLRSLLTIPISSSLVALVLVLMLVHPTICQIRQYSITQLGNL